MNEGGEAKREEMRMRIFLGKYQVFREREQKRERERDE